MTAPVRFIRGRVVHAPARGSVEILDDAFLSVDPASGRIDAFHAQIQPADLVHFAPDAPESALALSPQQFLMPGFVDTHVHAPQYPYMGTATDVPLMQWLTKYTFPVEQSFEDWTVVGEWYAKLLDRTLAEGITTAQYFATIHLESTKKFADLLLERGQRALVGLVSMDRNAPDAYVSSSTQQSLDDAEAFVKYALAKRSDLLRPVITPRFIPTCTPELLRGLGQLAARYDVHVQSHISESLDEVAFVESLHPGRRDLELFQEAKLLTRKSCMAHAVHLHDGELDVLHQTGTAIACCPLSNFFFANGLLDVKKVLAKRVDVGLGTDVAGGYSPSMLRAIQTCVLATKALEMRDGTSGAPAESFDFKDAFWMATMGGALALGLEKEIGSFAVGKSLDASLVDVALGQNLDLSEHDTPADVFQKFIHNGDSRNFARVFVNGRVVHDTSKTKSI